MTLHRHCNERLPGGERLWRKLARAVGFDGVVEVYGYGVHGAAGRAQRSAFNGGRYGGVTVGYFYPGTMRIQVWTEGPCAIGRLVPNKPTDRPLEAFAHELGHFVQLGRGKYPPGRPKARARYEAVATRYGNALLRHVRG